MPPTKLNIFVIRRPARTDASFILTKNSIPALQYDLNFTIPSDIYDLPF